MAALKKKILAHAEISGDRTTPIYGLLLARRDTAAHLENCFYSPLVSVAIQGHKESIIGTEKYHISAGNCLIAAVDIPSVNYVLDASPDHPFLTVTLLLNRQLITQLISEIPALAMPHSTRFKGIRVGEADCLLLEAFLRLLALLDTPEEIPVFAPLIIKEIHLRLLMGPHGAELQALNTLGTQGNQIAGVVTWLRAHYREPVSVAMLASMAKMAPSTFHRHFKQITTLSPLQYQKRLRLYEAQQLMLFEHISAAEAGLIVGYESASQFNREYRRQFGSPPHADIKKLTQAKS